MKALKRHVIPGTSAELAEEVRLFPRYDERFAKPPVTTTKRRYVVQISTGFSLTPGRDKAWGTAEWFVRYGFARRARVLLVTTVTTTQVMRDFRALRGPKAAQAKNGRPDLQAVPS